MRRQIVHPAQDLEDLVHIAEIRRPLLHLFECSSKVRHARAEHFRDVTVDRCAAEVGRNSSAQVPKIDTRELCRDATIVTA